MKMYLQDVRDAVGCQWRLAPPASTYELAAPITDTWPISQQQVLRIMRKYPQHLVYVIADYEGHRETPYEGIYTIKAIGSEIDVREQGMSIPTRQTAARRAARTRKLRKGEAHR